ncbi:MAG: helix-turn-helix transcriptional regulator [Treponema sp.]|jgi:transcriptional regulator with XRE-family HTH domain|nr:helix-turn-helix transcriptional regulator [Treponema sp.]
MNEQKLRNILSKNLRKYRNYNKLSQAELAEKLDISIPFLSDIENGKKWISPRTLAKMADAFDIEAFELLRPENSIPDNSISILNKFTDDIQILFEKALNRLHDDYISGISEK